MAVKLSTRLEDAKGELTDALNAAEEAGEAKRERDLKQAIETVDDAIMFVGQFEDVARDLDHVLAWVR